MLSRNKDGYYIRDGMIYVQGSIDGSFKRYSTGKKDTKLNVAWIKKNSDDEFKRIYEQKNRIIKVTSNFLDYANRSLELRKTKISEHTYKEYQQMLESRIKPFFKNYDTTKIKRIDLQAWQNNLLDTGLSGKRVNNIRSLFNTFLEDARKDEIIDKNPFSLVDRAKEVKPEVNPFSLEEVTQILKNCGGWEKSFLQIAFFSGLRTGELLGLRWEDINFITKKINIRRSIRKGTIGNTKNQNSLRTIDMLPLVEKALIEQKFNTFMKNDFIFLNENGKHYYDAASIRNNSWKRILRVSKLDYRTLYQTRHTFASIMISKGEDMLWVSNVLGHGNLNITLSKYARFCKTDATVRASFLDDLDISSNTVVHSTAQNAMIDVSDSIKQITTLLVHSKKNENLKGA